MTAKPFDRVCHFEPLHPLSGPSGKDIEMPAVEAMLRALGCAEAIDTMRPGDDPPDVVIDIERKELRIEVVRYVAADLALMKSRATLVRDLAAKLEGQAPMLPAPIQVHVSTQGARVAPEALEHLAALVVNHLRARDPADLRLVRVTGQGDDPDIVCAPPHFGELVGTPAGHNLAVLNAEGTTIAPASEVIEQLVEKKATYTPGTADVLLVVMGTAAVAHDLDGTSFAQLLDLPFDGVYRLLYTIDQDDVVGAYLYCTKPHPALHRYSDSSRMGQDSGDQPRRRV